MECYADKYTARSLKMWIISIFSRFSADLQKSQFFVLLHDFFVVCLLNGFFVVLMLYRGNVMLNLYFF
jgi:hypothetical protein